VGRGQTQAEELTGQAGLRILRTILENEVTRRVRPPHRPNPSAGCVRSKVKSLDKVGIVADFVR
jgi:hypothetical protein